MKVNVDPRDSIFGDDIIIEYRHYSKTHYLGKESNVKLAYFEAKIEYYDINGIRISNDIVSKSDDAVAGFTRNSGYKIVEGVRVQVYARGGRDGLTSKYIFFKFGTAPRFTSYI